MAQMFDIQPLPVKYLGLPLMHRKLKKAEYAPLIIALENRFKSWSIRTLSYAGRLQLIKSVIYSTLNFWMSVYVIPKGCIDQIVHKCTRFLWGGNIDQRAFVKVSWKNICLPKNEGGLGLRDLIKWNVVLRLKLIWRLFESKDSLWVAWCQENKLKKKNFWTMKEQQKDSWIWKSLLALRGLAAKFLKCSVKDGRQCLFWSSCWLQGKTPLDLLSYKGPQRLGIPLSATVDKAVSLWSRNPLRARNMGVKEFLQLLQQEPAPSLDKGNDLWSWNLEAGTANGFNSHYTWECIRDVAEKVDWFDAVWYKGYTPKISFFMWTASLDRLPTKARLNQWNSNVSPTCLLCDVESETREHLFLHCDYTMQIWSKVLTKLGHMQFMCHNWSALITWLRSTSLSVPNLLKKIAVHAALYHLWNERNSRVHRQEAQTPEVLFKRIDRVVRDTILAQN